MMREIDCDLFIGCEEMDQPNWEDFGGSFRPSKSISIGVGEGIGKEDYWS